MNVDPKTLSVVMIAARIHLQDIDLRLDDLKEQHQHHNTQATPEPTTAAEKLHAQRAEITQRHLRQAQELRDKLAQAIAGLTR